jgi:hypothetical protein
LLGTDFQNVTVLAILDYESALGLADIPAMHENVYPYLPAGSPRDPSTYDYLKIRTSAGRTVVLGMPWINESSITLVSSQKMLVTIDGVGSADIARVRTALNQNGYSAIKIELQ